MKRRSLMTAALVFAMAAFLPAGCGSKPAPAETTEGTTEEQTSAPEESSAEQDQVESSEEPEDQASAEEITLTIIYAEPSKITKDLYKSDESMEYAKSVIEAFENANSNIKIELVSARLFQSLDDLGVQLVEDGADVIWIGWMESCAGGAEDLTPYLEKDNIDISIYGDAAKAMCVEDVQWGLPTPAGGYVMMVWDGGNFGHEDAAWEFIKFVCGEEGAKVYAENDASLEEENEN